MSVSTYQNDVARLMKDIADCDKDLGREQEKVARYQSDIASLEKSITATTSASMVSSKRSQIISKQKDLATTQKKIGEIGTKKAGKQSDLGRKQQSLKTAMDQEARTRDTQDKRRREDETRHAREVTRSMERQRHLQYEIESSPSFVDVSRLPENIKVLFLASSPQDQGQLRLDVEVREIQEKIRASKHRDSVELISRWAVRTKDLLQHLNEHSPRVIHFSGHGSQNGDILFEAPDGNTRAVSKDAIVQMMNATAENIRLVVFNSCFSRYQAEAVTAHIDAAIGMNDSISDVAAQVFAAQFYSAVGFGKSIRTAFDQAKVALMLDGIPEEDTPELFVRAGADAANIYLVKPIGVTSVAFVRSPTSILPDLKPQDITVLKAICTSDAKRKGMFVSLSDIAKKVELEGLSEEDVEESASILEDRGYLENKSSMRDYVFVSNLGFEKYATAFLPNYNEMNLRVGDAIVNQNLQGAEEIEPLVADLGADTDIVERIMAVFEERDFVKLHNFIGSRSRAHQWNPSLKRWIDNQRDQNR